MFVNELFEVAMEKKLLIFTFLLLFTGGYLTHNHSFAYSKLSIATFLPAKLQVDLEKQDASDNDTEDGSIKIKITGGVPPYRTHYLSTNSEVEQTRENSFEIKAKPGLYIFIIQDSKKTVIKKEVEVGVKK